MVRINAVTVAVAIAIAVLFTSGTYLTLQRDIVRVVWGVVLLSQAANVYLVTMGGFGGSAPIVDGGGEVTDPLVQALVLTAIVIGFGVTSFSLVLVYRFYQENGSIDLHEFGGGTEERESTKEGRS